MHKHETMYLCVLCMVLCIAMWYTTCEEVCILAEGKKGYNGFTEARARANKKYMSQFVEIKVRVTPEKRAAIQEHAQTMGESATTFINRAIDNQIAKDCRKGTQEAIESTEGARMVSLSSEREKAKKAAQNVATAKED